MYSRDPFNLRHTSSSASSLLRASPRASPTPVQRRALEPSPVQTHHRDFDLPAESKRRSSPPPSSPFARPTEKTLLVPHVEQMTSYALPESGASRNADWQSAAKPRARDVQSGGLGEKISGIFAQGDDGLPLYKDKPFRAPRKGELRLPRWLQQRRVQGGIVAGVLLLLWLTGFLSFSAAPAAKVKSAAKTQKASWFGGSSSKVDWEDRANQVRDIFKVSFGDYEQNGWGYDEYHPVTKKGQFMTPKGMGWIIVDALDTMMLMNLTDELAHSRQWIANSLDYDQDKSVNTFETTIRMLGGLLSAHYLSTTFPEKYALVDDGLSDDLYIEKATDLADRLLGAYETNSGIPYASVNLHSMHGFPSHADGGASSTAEATTLQLEMKYLAKLTGEVSYWEAAEQVMQAVDANNAPDGLVPIFIYADVGRFREETIRLGSRGDSYYEYLAKQYLQTSGQEPIYDTMWNESFTGVKKHLITYSYPHNFTILAERPEGLNRPLSPKMDHLVCFYPGTIALALTGGKSLTEARKLKTWTPQHDDDFRLAEELLKTCMGMYKVTPMGLAGEITHFQIHEPPLMYHDFDSKSRPRSPDVWGLCDAPSCASAKDDLAKQDAERIAYKDEFRIKNADAHNLQRPETVESLFYFWRITGDETYRKLGWEMFQAFLKYTKTREGNGYSSLHSVLTLPPALKDNMESFWLAETLKYFYLLFASDDILPLTDVVFNTEAHPFPRFELNRILKTGWQRGQPLPVRQVRDAPPSPQAQETVEVRTVAVTRTLVEEEAAAAATQTVVPVPAEEVGV